MAAPVEAVAENVAEEVVVASPQPEEPAAEEEVAPANQPEEISASVDLDNVEEEAVAAVDAPME